MTEESKPEVLISAMQPVIEDSMKDVKDWVSGIMQGAKDSQVNESRLAVDNLGEEIATDINNLEETVRMQKDLVA